MYTRSHSNARSSAAADPLAVATASDTYHERLRASTRTTGSHSHVSDGGMYGERGVWHAPPVATATRAGGFTTTAFGDTFAMQPPPPGAPKDDLMAWLEYQLDLLCGRTVAGRFVLLGASERRRGGTLHPAAALCAA
jgi:hypothetical protein